MRSERTGLLLIAAALLAVAISAGLFLQHQQSARLEQIRAQGVALVRSLARVEFDRLVATDAPTSPLRLVLSSRDNPDFAYAAVTGADLAPIADTSAPGVILPPFQIGANPAHWFGERYVEQDGERGFREFHAPLMAAGELPGFLRIGYREPGFWPPLGQWSTLAMLALPIFLLAPLAWFLIRREVAPLREAGEQMREFLQTPPSARVELTATGELGDFVSNFNRMVALARDRIESLEHQREDSQTTLKVLSYQKAKTEEVLRALPQGVMVLDRLGVTTFINPRFESLLGVEAAKAIGQPLREWCTSPELIQHIENVDDDGSGAGGQEFSPRDRPNLRLRLHSYPLFSPRDNNQVHGSLTVLEDVSVEMNARKARSEFVANLAHELKTPLHVIGMYAESLAGEDAEDEAYRLEVSNVITDEVHRVGGLISNMLNVTRIEMGSVQIERTRTRLRDLLKDVCDAQARSAQDAGIEIELSMDSDLSTVYVDKELFRTALNNLVGNAIKYSDPGTRVEVSAEETEEDLVIRVRDQGYGMSATDQARIFDKFFRSENPAVRAKNGHGLGLAMTREIVELHNGRLEVTSTLGEGSEFSVELARNTQLLREAI